MILAMIMTLENEEERSFVEELYYKYHEKMMGVCMKILRNPDDAQDALVETFVRIMNQVERYMEVEHLEGFVLVTAKHTAINLYNQKANRQDHVISSTYYENDNSKNIQIDIPDAATNIEQLILDEELISEVKALIQSLPVEFSTVITYKYLYNFRNSEIAEMLGIDRSLVNVRLFRAKQKLQKLLADRYDYH